MFLLKLKTTPTSQLLGEMWAGKDSQEPDFKGSSLTLPTWEGADLCCPVMGTGTWTFVHQWKALFPPKVKAVTEHNGCL